MATLTVNGTETITRAASKPEEMRTRASVGPAASGGDKMAPSLAFEKIDLRAIAQHMFTLMMRNVASDGYLFADPLLPDSYSTPGCVLAAPSFPANTPGVDQDYVFNWTRDAAITAIEIAAAMLPTGDSGGVQPLIDYAGFAATCQGKAWPTLAHACFTIEGNSRPWTEQSDGPALQSLALLQAFDQLDGATQAVAKKVISANLTFLLGEYKNETTNLWEEHHGFSFFARAAQLRFFRAIKSNQVMLTVPSGVDAAIEWLQNALEQHWNGAVYVSMMPAPNGYDPNIDIISACIYGGIPCTDTRLLATAAQLRRQWEEDGSPVLYPINQADRAQGLGPLLGRYPGDTYDGDMQDSESGDHPWALCTCNMAELYYTLAHAISGSGKVPLDPLSWLFFQQVGVDATTSADDAAIALHDAGDAMLKAVIYHSDHLELSEQFDGTTGYEKSVKNLTWSYASFLSAVRAKTGQKVEG